MIKKKGNNWYVIFDKYEYNAGPYTWLKATKEHYKALEWFSRMFKEVL